jgi:two-component sensor histidine kinase
VNKNEISLLYGNQDPYFTVALKTAAVLGAVFHIAMLVLFFAFDVHLLVYVNLFSIPLFSGILFLLQKKKINPNLAFSLATVEVFTHSFIGVLALGVESNLMAFVWLIPLVFIISVKYSIRSKTILALACGVLFFSSVILLQNTTPIYQLPKEYISIFGLFIVGICAFVAILIVIYFSKIVKHKEEVILREIHHRISNNSQTIISISKLYLRNSESDNFSNLTTEINSLNHVISGVHKLIFLNNDIGYVRTEKLFSALLLLDIPKDQKVHIYNTNIPIDRASSFALIIHVLSINYNVTIESISLGHITLQTEEALEKITNINHLELLEIFSEQIEAEINYFESSIEINFNIPLFIQL